MPFIPDDFSPPETAQLGEFSLRVLAPLDTDADYSAVMQSAARIRGVFAPNNDWPGLDLTPEQNRLDLERHFAEFHERSAFAYTLWDASGNYAACFYLKRFKSRHENDQRREICPVIGYLWVNEPFAAQDQVIYQLVRQWVQNAFPWPTVAWPGRQYTWQEWEALAQVSA